MSSGIPTAPSQARVTGIKPSSAQTSLLPPSHPSPLFTSPPLFVSNICLIQVCLRAHIQILLRRLASQPSLETYSWSYPTRPTLEPILIAYSWSLLKSLPRCLPLESTFRAYPGVTTSSSQRNSPHRIEFLKPPLPPSSPRRIFGCTSPRTTPPRNPRFPPRISQNLWKAITKYNTVDRLPRYLHTVMMVHYTQSNDLLVPRDTRILLSISTSPSSQTLFLLVIFSSHLFNYYLWHPFLATPEVIEEKMDETELKEITINDNNNKPALPPDPTAGIYRKGGERRKEKEER